MISRRILTLAIALMYNVIIHGVTMGDIPSGVHYSLCRGKAMIIVTESDQIDLFAIFCWIFV